MLLTITINLEDIELNNTVFYWITADKVAFSD